MASSLTVPIGQTITLSATPTLTGRGTAPADADYRWWTDNRDVACFDALPVGPVVRLQALAAGLATIRVRCLDFEDAVVIRIMESTSPIAGVSISAS